MKPLHTLLVALAVLLTGCQTTAPDIRARAEDEGALYLYLQPLPQAAERLRFVIAGLSIVDSEGRELMLPVALHELKGQDVKRQRLLAAGPLPPGQYSGVVFRTASASLKGEGGESALLVPETPVKIGFKFTIRRGEALVLSLVMNYGEAVEARFRFSPAFAIYRPERPPIASVGFVANSRSNDITAFDKRSLQVFDVIATGREPSSMALDQRGRKLWVALSRDDAVDLVDIMSGNIAERVRLSPGDEPVGLALTPDATTLFSANHGSNTASVIDAVSRVEMTKIAVGNGPRWVAIDQMGRRAFVVNTLSNSVSVIDIPSRAVIRTIPTDPNPVQAQFNRRGDRLYVIHEIAAYVTVINPMTLAVSGRFPIRSGMDAIKVDPNTDLVYLAGRREFSVGAYEPQSFVALDFVNAGPAVVHMATDMDQNALYLVSSFNQRVVVSDRIRKRLVGEIDVGAGPCWISVMGEN